MSVATMTMTAAAEPTINIPTIIASPCCPNCGSSLPALAASDPRAALLQAQKQVKDLEAQVRLLNEKASAAVDRWADYEDELARLRAKINDNHQNNKEDCPIDGSVNGGNGSATANGGGAAQNMLPTPDPSIPPTSPRSSGFLSGRISQLLSPRFGNNANNTKNPPNNLTSKSTPHLPMVEPAPPSPPSTPSRSNPRHLSTDDLMEALDREQRLRIAAEGKLDETSREVEELSVTLFEQANEMVANERRARAKLEERVGELERRDVEKRGRLEKLEGAMGRIERVRSLLGCEL